MLMEDITIYDENREESIYTDQRTLNYKSPEHIFGYIITDTMNMNQGMMSRTALHRVVFDPEHKTPVELKDIRYVEIAEGEIHLYAGWEKELTVYFHGNGGLVDGDPDGP